MKPQYSQVHLDGTPSTIKCTETKGDMANFDESKDLADILKDAGYTIAFDTKPRPAKKKRS